MGFFWIFVLHLHCETTSLFGFTHLFKSVFVIALGFYLNVQKCHVKKKDIRKFLDGIYVSEKSKIVEEEQTNFSRHHYLFNVQFCFTDQSTPVLQNSACPLFLFVRDFYLLDKFWRPTLSFTPIILFLDRLYIYIYIYIYQNWHNLVANLGSQMNAPECSISIYIFVIVVKTSL